jgi:hypothetical protein
MDFDLQKTFGRWLLLLFPLIFIALSFTVDLELDLKSKILFFWLPSIAFSALLQIALDTHAKIDLLKKKVILTRRLYFFPVHTRIFELAAFSSVVIDVKTVKGITTYSVSLWSEYYSVPLSGAYSVEPARELGAEIARTVGLPVNDRV